MLDKQRSLEYNKPRYGRLAQLARASAWRAEGHRFESYIVHHTRIIRTFSSSGKRSDFSFPSAKSNDGHKLPYALHRPLSRTTETRLWLPTISAFTLTAEVAKDCPFSLLVPPPRPPLAKHRSKTLYLNTATFAEKSVKVAFFDSKGSKQDNDGSNYN